MAGILIKNGRVWNGEAFLYADVLIDGRLVAKIAPKIRDEANFVLDAEGMIVSPGLVDAHTHLRGVSCDKYGTQAEISCFPFGVTAAADGAASKGDKKLLESFMLKTVAFAGAEIKDNRADFSNTERIIMLFLLFKFILFSVILIQQLYHFLIQYHYFQRICQQHMQLYNSNMRHKME